jgi:hypothetical protein
VTAPDGSTDAAARAQDLAYPDGHDYTAGSPHLAHERLRRRIDASLTEEVAALGERRGACRTLEIGAGHGTFTRVLRAAGATVTVTEMSGGSAAHLSRLFAADAEVQVIHDATGDWSMDQPERFDLIVAISVLHHIPDYLEAVARWSVLTNRGGTFLSWQDPLWYGRVPRWTRWADRGAYLGWRLGQGDVRHGVGARLRRLRGVYDESQVSDMAEYHVVRQGVDEVALEELLRAGYAECRVERYWSTQAAPLQRLGERLGLGNTFSIQARDRRPR